MKSDQAETVRIQPTGIWQTGRGRVSGEGRGRYATVLGAIILVILLSLGAVGVNHSQTTGEQQLAKRFDTRASLAGRFIGTYAQQVIEREKRLAEARLSAEPGEADFSALIQSFGFQAAVLLDDGGRLLNVAPANQALRGRDITGSYSHLQQAVGGTAAVSEVVPSVARGVPVIAFATPFATPTGQRVFSGAYEVSETPLDAFMADALPFADGRLYLVDTHDRVAASTSEILEKVRVLSDVDAQLSTAVQGSAQGNYRGRGEQRHFTVVQVPGTPWRVVADVPTESLYAPLEGSRSWLPWLLLALAAVLAFVAGLAIVRYMEGRRQLFLLSRVDALTGIANRRALEEQMLALSSSARRRGQPLSLLMVDIDHFKRFNDQFGHQVGDSVLRTTAQRLTAALRPEDFLGRWGGEEFLVLLAQTPEDGAAATAERLRMVVSSFAGVDDRQDSLTVSIGVATSVEDDPVTLLRRADAALYLAKNQGRDRVAMAGK